MSCEGSTCSGSRPAGDDCDDDFDCTSGMCIYYMGSEIGRCSEGHSGDDCNSNADCRSNVCVLGDGFGKCSDGEPGSKCEFDSDCDSQRCVSNKCTMGAPGDPCETSDDCIAECRAGTSGFASDRACGYSPWQECPDGRADCFGDCQAAQESCEIGECTATCDRGGCDDFTLATWDFSDHAPDADVTGRSLVVVGAGVGDGVRASIGTSTGAHYWEIRVDSLGQAGYTAVGVATADWPLTALLGEDATTSLGYTASGIVVAGDEHEDGCDYQDRVEIIGVAIDFNAHRIYFSIDGVWLAGSDPEAREGGLPLEFPPNEPVFPAASVSLDDRLVVNFGQGEFKYHPPPGFEALFE